MNKITEVNIYVYIYMRLCILNLGYILKKPIDLKYEIYDKRKNKQIKLYHTMNQIYEKCLS